MHLFHVENPVRCFFGDDGSLVSIAVSKRETSNIQYVYTKHRLTAT